MRTKTSITQSKVIVLNYALTIILNHQTNRPTEQYHCTTEHNISCTSLRKRSFNFSLSQQINNHLTQNTPYNFFLIFFTCYIKTRVRETSVVEPRRWLRYCRYGATVSPDRRRKSPNALVEAGAKFAQSFIFYISP